MDLRTGPAGGPAFNSRRRSRARISETLRLALARAHAQEQLRVMFARLPREPAAFVAGLLVGSLIARVPPH